MPSRRRQANHNCLKLKRRKTRRRERRKRKFNESTKAFHTFNQLTNWTQPLTSTLAAASNLDISSSSQRRNPRIELQLLLPFQQSRALTLYSMLSQFLNLRQPRKRKNLRQRRKLKQKRRRNLIKSQRLKQLIKPCQMRIAGRTQ